MPNQYLFLIVLALFSISWTQVPTGYSAFFSENMDSRDITWFDHGKNGYWQFYWNVNADPNLTMRRARYQLQGDLSNQVLRINRYAEDQDYTGSGLNPRCELRFEKSTWKFQKNSENLVRIRTRHLSDQGNATFLQIMHRYEGGAYPIMQMEALGNKYSVRGRYVARKELTTGASITADVGKWVQWEIRFKASHTDNGYLELYKNGNRVFSQSGLNSSTYNNEIWIQVGLYGSTGIVKSVEFDDVVFATKTGQVQSSSSSLSVSSSSSIPQSSASIQLHLYNTQTDQPIQEFAPLRHGDTIQFNTTKPNLTVLAMVQGSGIHHVQFNWNSTVNYRTESIAPFALAGDIGNGDLIEAPFTTGLHIIQAIGYDVHQAELARVEIQIVLIPQEDVTSIQLKAKQIPKSLVHSYFDLMGRKSKN